MTAKTKRTRIPKAAYGSRIEGDKLSISKEMQLDKESHRSAMSETKPSKRAKEWFNRKPYSIKGSGNDGQKHIK